VKHVVVPYTAANSTVRTRALHWIWHLTNAGCIDADDVRVHGPGQRRSPIDRGEPLLLLRNARRVTRGRREARLLGNAALGVYDIDDGLPWDHGNLPGLGRWWKRPFPRSLVAERAACAADRVIVGNDVLADWACGMNRDVRVIPTCVDPTDYVMRTSWAIAGGVPVIGWIGSLATEHYLLDIADALREVHRRTGARLEMISSPGSVPPALSDFTTRIPWSPASTKRIGTWDIGIMPLRDGVYERAKCGYKLLQYGASGVPVIASPVGVNVSLVSEMSGLSPATEPEWVDAITHMLEESADHRGRRASQGRAVALRYSYGAWESAWQDAVGW
jgi:glycosyltransferase involved in cell wall biosynthesis